MEREGERNLPFAKYLPADPDDERGRKAQGFPMRGGQKLWAVLLPHQGARTQFTICDVSAKIFSKRRVPQSS
jgi:hypothetical protein